MATTPVPSRRRPAARPVDRSAASADSGACKRERILDVAEELFFRHGYRGTTLDMICGELGVTKPFVYYYFEDKQEILETLVWRVSVATLTALKFPAGDSRPAHVRLAEGLRRFVHANIADFRASALSYRNRAIFRPVYQARLRRLANAFYDDFCALLEAGRAEGKLSFDETKLTALAMGSVTGFMYTWYRPGGRLAPEAMAKKITAILFRMAGLRAKP